MATNSIWRIMSDLENIRGRDYHNRYVEMVAQDGEKRLHSPELYAIWNLKTYMMVVASIMNPFRSEFFIYTDTGAWRHRNLTNWPDQTFLPLLAKHLDNRILYAQVRDPSKDNFSPRLNFVEGFVYFLLLFVFGNVFRISETKKVDSLLARLVRSEASTTSTTNYTMHGWTEASSLGKIKRS